jgi:hypothetical protein
VHYLFETTGDKSIQVISTLTDDVLRSLWPDAVESHELHLVPTVQNVNHLAFNQVANLGKNKKNQKRKRECELKLKWCGWS